MEPNVEGKDFVVGDIHGHFRKLDNKLEEIGFNFEQDRLFVVGDLIDRGPYSHECLDYLKKDWFYSIKGNHEEFLVRGVDFMLRGCPADDMTGIISYNTWMGNGGRWFEDLKTVHGEDLGVKELKEYMVALDALPYFMEIPVQVDGTMKKVAMVHAEINDTYDWNDVVSVSNGLEVECTDASRLMRDAAWSRSRIERCGTSVMYGKDHSCETMLNIDAVFCGHTPIIEYTDTAPFTIGNIHYIDTWVYGQIDNNFQIIDLKDFLS